LTSVTRIAGPLLPWSDCGSDDALLLLPVPEVFAEPVEPLALVSELPVLEVLLEVEVLGVDSDIGVLELLLVLPLALGDVELAEVDPLGLVLDAELMLPPFSHVPLTSTLWPT